MNPNYTDIFGRLDWITKKVKNLLGRVATLEENGGGGGTSTGVNGLTGTTNIGLGGTLLNSTTIDADGYDFTFNNINNYYLLKGDYGFQISQYDGIIFGDVLGNNTPKFNIDCSSNLIYTSFQSFYKGFVLNYNDDLFSFGYSGYFDISISIGNRKISIGDWDGNNNGTAIIIDDPGQGIQFSGNNYLSLFSTNSGFTAQSSITKVGDWYGGNNNTFIGIDDSNQTIIASSNLINAGAGIVSTDRLKINVSGTDYYIVLETV